MGKLFISHRSQDDGFVRQLQQALGHLNEDVWIDSREFRGGDPLWTDIQKAIEEASAYAVLVSPHALQSKWVGKELRHALKVQKRRGNDELPVIPLSLDGTKLGVLEEFFKEEPLYIPVTTFGTAHARSKRASSGGDSSCTNGRCRQRTRRM